MALCNLCLSVPFASLPPPPEQMNASSYIGDNRDLPQLHITSYGIKKGRVLNDPVGFPWHEDLDALAACAASCALCAMVQEGVNMWIAHYRDVEENNKHFIEFEKANQPIPGPGERLWLTKRLCGAPGFLVFIRRGKSSLNFMAGVGFVTEPGLTKKMKTLLRPLEANSGSPSSLEIAASWLKGCVEEHENCSKEVSTLPSRVLDIGSQPSGNIVKLVYGAGLSGHYACLSYCWGSSPHFTTSRESIVARQQGFNLSELPKTFLHAITIARHLGIRYLWIDSLCICQDDTEDWARESSRMIDIYSNAHIVIAVNHAKDSSVGCFHDRPPRATCLVEIPGYTGKMHAVLLYTNDEWKIMNGEFQGEALTERGWALQERVLARRILHYNTRQMYFECDHGLVGEYGCNGKNRFNIDLEKADIDEWHNLLWAYGNRKLTKATDKLPAMSGLARLFEKRLKAQYVAGLWSTNLIEGLAWQCLGKEKQAMAQDGKYIGPSWSWAGFDGIAATGKRKGWKDIAEVQEWNVQLKTEANPYGEITGAWIRIHAPLIRLVHSEEEVTEHEIRLRRAGLQPFPRFRTPHSDEDQVVSLDNAHSLKSEEWRSWNIQVLILGGYPYRHGNWGKDQMISKEPEDEKKENKVVEEENSSGEDLIPQTFGLCFGLVLDNRGTENQGVKRVGWMFLNSEEVAKAIEEKKDWSTVKLI